MRILNHKQNTPEWLQSRLGKVTASEIDSLISPTGKVRTGDGPQTYLYKKLTEKLLGVSLDSGSPSSFAMDQGQMIEAEAIPWYSFAHGVQIDRVGFCESDCGRYGMSPDGLIGEDGGIEIKSPQPANAVEYLLEGVIPRHYVCQVQFQLYVSKRKWWKFVSYSRQLPALVVHVEPDPKIQEAIHVALTAFLAKFDEKLALIADMKRKHDQPLTEAYEAKIKAWENGGPTP